MCGDFIWGAPVFGQLPAEFWLDKVLLQVLPTPICAYWIWTMLCQATGQEGTLLRRLTISALNKVSLDCEQGERQRLAAHINDDYQHNWESRMQWRMPDTYGSLRIPCQQHADFKGVIAYCKVLLQGKRVIACCLDTNRMLYAMPCKKEIHTQHTGRSEGQGTWGCLG